MLPFQVGRIPSILPQLPDVVMPMPRATSASAGSEELSVHLPGDHVSYEPEEEQQVLEPVQEEEEEEEQKYPHPQPREQTQHTPSTHTPTQPPAREDEQEDDLPRRSTRARTQTRPSTATPSARSRARRDSTHEHGGGSMSLPVSISKEMTIAFETTVDQDVQPPTSFNKIKDRPDAQLWIEAINNELQNMENMKVWREVSRDEIGQGAEVIAPQWVFAVKREADGSILRKARLVACGNQETYNNLSSYSPTSRPQTFRLLLSVAAQRGLRLEQWDVKSAYLEAKLDQEVFLRPPPGVNKPNTLLKLERALYGLRRAGKLWNQTLHAELIRLGLKQSQHDPCLYYNNNIFLLCYVDDIISAHKVGDKEFARIRKDIFTRFRMKDLKLHTFLGVEIKQCKDKIFINQSKYAMEILKRHHFLEVNEKATPMVSNLKLPLVQGMGEPIFPLPTTGGGVILSGDIHQARSRAGGWVPVEIFCKPN